MKTIFDHIEHVKGKPHHIRKRVAFTAAGCGAGVIALVWLAGSLTTGAFAIKGSNFTDSANQGSVITTSGDSTSQLAGVGAAAALNQAEEAPVHIEIVNTASEPSKQKQAEQTTIPF